MSTHDLRGRVDPRDREGRLRIRVLDVVGGTLRRRVVSSEARAAETCVDIVDAGVDDRDRHPFARFTEGLPRLVCADESDARSVAGLSQRDGMNRLDSGEGRVPCGILRAV